MGFDLDKHRRRSIRLPGYDYTQAGAYFITACTHVRACLFGTIVDGVMALNAFGEIVRDEWLKSAQIRREIQLDGFVVMPNHIHGIVVVDPVIPLSPPVGAHGRAPLHRKPKSLGAFMAGFKPAVTRRVNEICHTPGNPVWQRNYYEHVIRDESELGRIREYILSNPQQWEADKEYRPL